MDFSTLNPKQLEAVQTLEGPLLILAGAGSGKTRTLTCRIANLLEHGVPAWRILALTFTNKAAREMQTRVEKLVGPEMAADMWIGTFRLRADLKAGYREARLQALVHHLRRRRPAQGHQGPEQKAQHRR